MARRKKQQTPEEEKRKWIIQVIRRASFRWLPRNLAKSAARVERGKYQCAQCKGLFGPKEIALDHIDPVIDPHTGFIDWNHYIERLFCDQSGFQVLCKKVCHPAKSKVENEVRRQTRKKA